MDLRRRAVALLRLRPGESVLDVACGTGLSLPLLVEAVGASGRVVGVEVSPDMICRARLRVAAAGWENVTLVEAPMETAPIEPVVDAVLFNYTHDVLQSPAALANIFARVRPGGRVVMAGIKHPPAWLFPLRLYRLLKAGPYVTTLAGLDRPWRLAETYLTGLTVRSALLGTNYLACGTARG